MRATKIGRNPIQRISDDLHRSRRPARVFAAAVSAVAPAVLSSATFVATVSAQQTYLLSDGRPVVWGNVASGQAVLPTLPANTYVRAISPGQTHVSALLSDGSIIGWGSNASGQLDTLPLPTGVTYTGVSAGNSTTLALRSDGNIVGWGMTSDVLVIPAKPAGTSFLSIDNSPSHAVALRSDGNISAWGLNNVGQLNVPAPSGGLTYVSVSAGTNYSIALRSNNTLVGWGSNLFNVINIPTFPAGTNILSVSAGDQHVLALRADGQINAWGNPAGNPTAVPTLPAGLTYTGVAAGLGYSLALRSNGTIIGFGSNNSNATSVPPLSAGGFYTAVATHPAFSTSAAISGITQFPGNLRLTGFATDGVTNTVRRNITVDNDLIVDGSAVLVGSPLIEVGGHLRLNYQLPLSGSGTLNVAGNLVTANSGFHTLSDLTLSVGGRVTGNAGLGLNSVTATFALSSAISFGSYLYIYGDSVVDFTGSGRFGSSGLLINPGANLRIGAGQSYLNSSSGYNAGQLDLLGAGQQATFESKLTFSNYVPGQINANNAVLRFPGGFSNFSKLVSTAGHTDVFGNVNNFNDSVSGTGSILITGGASVTFYNNLINNGSITVSQSGSTSSVLTVLGTLSGAGSIVGAGDTFIEGTFSPGNSPAAVLVEGDLHLTPTSTLLLELGGATLGTGYDHVDIGGTLHFGGTLKVVPIDGWSPLAAESYDLLDFMNRSGAFSQIILPELPAPFAWDTSQLYSSGILRFTLPTVPEPAGLGLLSLTVPMLARRRRA